MQQCVYSEQLVELMTACMKGLYEIDIFFFTFNHAATIQESQNAFN